MGKRDEAARIDQEKVWLEASAIPKLKKIFSNMASDAQALYTVNGSIPADELSQNYYPEFLKEVRDIMRKSIKFFGFDIRGILEKKHGIFFDVEYKRNCFDIQFKKLTTIDDPALNTKLNTINNEFMREVTLFVANQSENQARFITDTNAKEIFKALSEEQEKFRIDLESQAARISDLESQPISPKVTRQIESARTQFIQSQAEAQTIIGKNLKVNLIDKSIARSDLITSQNTGLSEAWARQTEGKLINDARLATATGKIANVVKTWIAILDTKTRLSHAEADFQQVAIDDSYSVNGEALLYPRDPKGSARNVINCRCVSIQEVELE